jgi:hypothetical protein
MRWQSASLAASSLVVLLAGCGGGGQAERTTPQPKLPGVVAHQLAARADRIASRLDAGDTCGALAQATALRSEVTVAINTGRIPRAFLEPLSSSVNGLVGRVGSCQPAAGGGQGRDEEHGHGRGHEKKKRKHDGHEEG